MTKKIIGMLGNAGHGKDTAVKVLCDLGFGRFSFADPVREMALALDPFVDFAMTGQVKTGCAFKFIRLSEVVKELGWEKAKKDHDVRQILQRLGTDCCRDIIDTNVWIDLLFRRSAYCDAIAISDVRFPNEADAVKARGGLIWRIFRPEYDSGVPADHPSEAQVDLIAYDRLITNDGTLQDLAHTIREALAETQWAAA
jgi:hypothetical protein